AVPLNKRKIVAGTEYFIHNPLLNNVRGNSEQLIQAANYIKPYETAMLNMYAKATGLDKATLQGLMAQETSLTDEQAKALGFA
ncbi:MAG TPA: ATP-dependent Clp protease proteolytic subunit, partial [Vicingus sp.]|nr:ATP-dependent Clp protease proteolytic subunit [Vicingus sp.]